MLSGLGLGTLGGVDKIAPKPLAERKNSSTDSILMPEAKAEDTSLSNSSSSEESKSLDKRESISKSAQKSAPKKSEFSKKLSQLADEDETKTETDSSEINTDSKLEYRPTESKFDKKILSAKDVNANHKVDTKKSDDKKIRPTSNVNVSELAQMQMLNIPNQFNVAQATSKKDDTSIEAVSQSGITKIDQLPKEAQPVARFLQSMYENFGIKPEKIINALNQLPPNVLLESPHEAMTPLFEKLELQPKQFTKAQIMFNEMVTDLENIAQPTAQVATMQAPQLVVGTKKGHHASATAQKPTLDALIEQKWNRRALEPQNYRVQSDAPKTDMSLRSLTPAQAAKMAQATSQTVPQEAPAANLSQIFHIDPQQVARMQAQSPQNNLVAVDKLQEYDPNIQIQEVKLNPNKITDKFFVDGQDKTLTQLQQMQLKNLGQKEQGQDKEKLKDELKNKLGEQNLVAPQDVKVENQFSTIAHNKVEAALTPNLTDIKNNATQLTESTKSLIAKGGGEMKIQLHPEGMGQVNLKVHVQDGQVAVQMTADSHEAKKLLETGLNDLKLSLAEHRLNVNHMKVDVSEQLKNNMMNMEQNMKREEARDFLGQFRDWNESLRQANVGPGSTRAYQSQPKAPSIQKSRGANADGRLYLVA